LCCGWSTTTAIPVAVFLFLVFGLPLPTVLGQPKLGRGAWPVVAAQSRVQTFLPVTAVRQLVQSVENARPLPANRRRLVLFAIPLLPGCFFFECLFCCPVSLSERLQSKLALDPLSLAGRFFFVCLFCCLVLISEHLQSMLALDPLSLLFLLSCKVVGSLSLNSLAGRWRW
jgi:hypothetical protein